MPEVSAVGWHPFSAGRRNGQDKQHARTEQQRGQRSRHRRRPIGLADHDDLDLQGLKTPQRRDVYSPSTTATEMNAAERMPEEMLGTTTRRIVGRPARPQRPGRFGSMLQVDRGQRRVDGPVGEWQHQRRRRRTSASARVEQEVGHPQVDVAQADRTLHDSRSGARRRDPHPRVDQGLVAANRGRKTNVLGVCLTGSYARVPVAASAVVAVAIPRTTATSAARPSLPIQPPAPCGDATPFIAEVSRGSAAALSHGTPSGLMLTAR